MLFLIVPGLREMTGELATVARLTSTGIKVNGPLGVTVNEWPSSVGVVGFIGVEVAGSTVGSSRPVDVNVEVRAMPPLQADVSADV